MVKITFFQNRSQQITGFDCLGHAEYSDGDDIVCAAVSALVINCINSIEILTPAEFRADSEQETGMIRFALEDSFEEYSQLLLKSLMLGLQEMESNYEQFIDVVIDQEV